MKTAFAEALLCCIALAIFKLNSGIETGILIVACVILLPVMTGAFWGLNTVWDGLWSEKKPEGEKRAVTRRRPAAAREDETLDVLPADEFDN